ncbi:hypothetical protein, unlikely [Trypanosoma brucei gambiense DAL972]|uniref:Uncharacterized protein n=1 Tax=Trypanosoma brucei gambiense (strain MHOM/CI/86/DAL972) TaxID=679716 RepID=C9ZVD6_TRYB9|nr:hypothetical protein, unlikely [Trypanosoma brucei gambiense DAL972]CBH13374.1 hypothetical protein, unlikely [Trypanosoma brucei gambiense DAL972]|eukprot:XP_011775651.1 hypothetical protein, unlikely [Trypanosoma brucei gambiense DAL972]
MNVYTIAMRRCTGTYAHGGEVSYWLAKPPFSLLFFGGRDGAVEFCIYFYRPHSFTIGIFFNISISFYPASAPTTECVKNKMLGCHILYVYTRRPFFIWTPPPFLKGHSMMVSSAVIIIF